MASKRNGQARKTLLEGDDTVTGMGYVSSGGESDVDMTRKNVSGMGYEFLDDNPFRRRMEPSELGGNPASTFGFTTEYDEQSELLTTKGSEFGQSELFGRTTRRGDRGPAIPSPHLDWGPGRGIDTEQQQSLAGSGYGGKKRRNEGDGDEARQSKAVKLFDTWSQDGKFWKPVAIQAQQQKYASKVTGTNVLGHGREAANMIGQAVGGASDAIAAKITGETRDALKCLVGGCREAVSRSATGEVLTTFTPIHRASGQDTAGQMGSAPKGRQQVVLPWQIKAPKAKRVDQKNASRSSSVVPFTPPSAQRAQDGTGNALAPGNTAQAAGEAASSGTGKEAADESRLLVNQLRQQQGVDQAPPTSPGPKRKKPRADGPQPRPQTPPPSGPKDDGAMGTEMGKWQAALQSASDFWSSFEPRLFNPSGSRTYEMLLHSLRKAARDEVTRSRFMAFLQSDVTGWYCVEHVVDSGSESAVESGIDKCTLKRHRKAGECLRMRRVGGRNVDFQYMTNK